MRKTQKTAMGALAAVALLGSSAFAADRIRYDEAREPGRDRYV